jgi:hypothetical protein
MGGEEALLRDAEMQRCRDAEMRSYEVLSGRFLGGESSLLTFFLCKVIHLLVAIESFGGFFHSTFLCADFGL